jgi:Predicted sugar nucleotidyltransferases
VDASFPRVASVSVLVRVRESSDDTFAGVAARGPLPAREHAMREAAIILAGGRGRRLAALPPGGKAAVEIGGRSLLEVVVALRPWQKNLISGHLAAHSPIIVTVPSEEPSSTRITS